MDKPFLTDIKELRRRARSHIEEGAVTEASKTLRNIRSIYVKRIRGGS